MAALHAAGDPHDGLLVADWADPHAVAVPPARGRAGHVLVTSGLLRLLDPAERGAVLAHERAHLAHGHHRTAAAGTVAAAAHPLLRGVAATIDLLVERSADETAAAAVGSRPLVARTIARVALAAHAAPGPAFGGSDVRHRVEALTAPAGRRGAPTLAATVTLALLSMAATTGAAAAFVRVAQVWIAGR
ncbi:M48 family metalloprotease [Dactylosporangium sp. CA-092794]|uniref:M48 family metalloprotease n=1 Tax=Dactylosporangium sp. CA-092794 TaxID=3239929 RepID=UPI003D8F0F06